MLICTSQNAILMYAAEKSGNDAMYPKDIKKRADVSRAC
jgi:glutathione S-transferase